MSSTINRLIFVLMLLWTAYACTSSTYANLLSQPLSQRTLRINPETLDGFIYCGRVCDKYSIGICWGKWEQVCDHYLFTDKIKMKTLSDAEMVLKQRQKP